MKAFRQGILGEWQAARYVRRQGMRILARRYRTAHGEIDLIARDGDTLVFIEVKSRPRGAIGEGVRAVGADKRRHMAYAAQCYLLSHGPADKVRFDVIEITASGPWHIKNAF